MNRLTIFLPLLFAWTSVSAKVVSVDQARCNAAAFFSKAMPQTKVSVSADNFRLISSFPETRTKAMTEPAVYVFGIDGGGYVVASADDVARPVLGWSLGENFPDTDIPDNMRAVLDWYVDIIGYARTQGWVASVESSREIWNGENSVLLETAPWSQGTPFNDLVPEIGGKKPPVGCVATAISIIMRFHQWPLKGNGTLPSYDYDLSDYGAVHIDGIELGHKYDWSKMPSKVYGFSEEESAQIARLLYDVAVMCRMNFHPGGSGAHTLWAQEYLPVYFGYDKSIRSYYRNDSFSDTQWERIVADEIDAGRPVLYSGYSHDGHAFVIDGYNGRYFHINFGWGGGVTSRQGHDDSLGAFYTLTPLDGHEADLLVFYYEQNIVSHIMPDCGGEPVADLYCCNGDLELITGIPSDFVPGKDFPIVHAVRNSTLGVSTLETALALCGGDGRIKRLCSVPFTAEVGWSGTFLSFNANVSGQLDEGDALVVIYRNPGEQEWSKVMMGRSSKIVFTKRPLLELVELGYTNEPLTGTDYDDCPPLHLYMDIYKDLIWGIRPLQADGPAGYMCDSKANINLYPFLYWEDESIETVSLYEDDETEHLEFYFPPGDYILHLENPATGEMMDVNLRL